MFQALFLSHDFLENSLQKSFQLMSFECYKSIRNYKKNTAWNIRLLDDELFVPTNQRTSVLYCRLSDFMKTTTTSCTWLVIYQRELWKKREWLTGLQTRWNVFKIGWDNVYSETSTVRNCYFVFVLLLKIWRELWKKRKWLTGLQAPWNVLKIDWDNVYV